MKRELIRKANQWLAQNSDLAVIGCETIAVLKNEDDSLGAELNSKLSSMAAHNIPECYHFSLSGFYELDLIKCLRYTIIFLDREKKYFCY